MCDVGAPHIVSRFIRTQYTYTNEGKAPAARWDVGELNDTRGAPGRKAHTRTHKIHSPSPRATVPRLLEYTVEDGTQHITRGAARLTP